VDQLMDLPQVGTPLAADGQQVDFDAFVAQRLHPLIRYATMLAGSRELAEDIVQDALVKAHGKWTRISGLDHPDLYVKRMVTNEFLSWRRRTRLRTIELEDEHHETVMGGRPPGSEQSSADRDALWAELARLSRQQRAVLVLPFYEGLTDIEIAEVLGCRPATVRGYCSRALSALRIELADWPNADGSPKTQKETT